MNKVRPGRFRIVVALVALAVPGLLVWGLMISEPSKATHNNDGQQSETTQTNGGQQTKAAYNAPELEQKTKKTAGEPEASAAIVAPSRLATTQASATNLPVAVFIGDSYTQAVGNENDRWTTQSARALGWREVNLGIGGTGYATYIIYQGVYYPPYRDRVAEVASHSPDIVVVSGGRNDLGVSLATFETAAQKFISDLNAALPRARIIVTAPLWHHTTPPVQLQQMQTPLITATNIYGGCFIDLNNPLSGHPEYIYPGDIHPNSAGHTALAKAFVAAVKPMAPTECVDVPVHTRPSTTVPAMPGPTRPSTTVPAMPGPRRPA